MSRTEKYRRPPPILTWHAHQRLRPSQTFSLASDALAWNVGATCSVRLDWSGMDDKVAAKMTGGDRHPVAMVVDDDALVRATVAEMLEDLCDEVYQAADGVEGLELLREHPDITLVVTDIAMPRLNGLAFACRARRMQPDLKVLFVSGRQRPPISEEFLEKPFRSRALLSAVTHLLETHAP
jgi:CheY-like chemotaxis protein